MISDHAKACASWCVDAITSMTVLVLLLVWIVDINSASSDGFFISKSFLQNGFCLSPLFHNTHFSCAMFDLMCGITCMLGIVLGIFSLPRFGGIAAYFIAHSYGHYNGATELTRPGSTLEERILAKDLVVLAAILSIGPFTVASYLVDAKKWSRAVGNVVATVALASSVAIYFLFIKRPCYALLYINVSILLTTSLPKAILVGYKRQEDIEIRSSKFRWPKVVSQLLVAAIVFIEPLSCDSFLKSIGGHFIFDFFLAADAFVDGLLSMKQDKDTLPKDHLIKIE